MSEDQIRAASIGAEPVNADASKDDPGKEEPGLKLLRLLIEEDGQSMQRVARQLGMEISGLARLLTALGDDPRGDGLELITQSHDGQRLRLWLTDKGKRLCANR